MWGSLRRSLRVAQECRRCHAMSSAACGPSSRLSAFTFVGPSGFGKSSNLRCLNRLVEPSSASTDEMTRIWEGFYRGGVSRPGSRPSASGPFLRSIAVWPRGITDQRLKPFKNVIFAKSLGNPLALLRQLPGVKMTHDVYRRIIIDGRRRETEGVSLSLGSSDTRMCHAGDELADSGGARAAGRFSTLILSYGKSLRLASACRLSSLAILVRLVNLFVLTVCLMGISAVLVAVWMK